MSCEETSWSSFKYARGVSSTLIPRSTLVPSTTPRASSESDVCRGSGISSERSAFDSSSSDTEDAGQRREDEPTSSAQAGPGSGASSQHSYFDSPGSDSQRQDSGTAPSAPTEVSFLKRSRTASSNIESEPQSVKRRKKAFFCNICSKAVASTKFDFEMHLKAKHGDLEAHPCLLASNNAKKKRNCMPSFKSVRSFRRHLRKVHKLAEDGWTTEEQNKISDTIGLINASGKRALIKAKAVLRASFGSMDSKAQSLTDIDSFEVHEVQDPSATCSDYGNCSYTDDDADEGPPDQGNSPAGDQQGQDPDGHDDLYFKGQDDIQDDREQHRSGDRRSQGSNDQRDCSSQPSTISESASLYHALRSLQVNEKSQPPLQGDRSVLLYDVTQRRELNKEGYTQFMIPFLEELNIPVQERGLPHIGEPGNVEHDIPRTYYPTGSPTVPKAFVVRSFTASTASTASKSLFSNSLSGRSKSSATTFSRYSDKPAKVELYGIYRCGPKPLTIPDEPAGDMMQRWYGQIILEDAWSPFHTELGLKGPTMKIINEEHDYSHRRSEVVTGVFDEKLGHGLGFSTRTLKLKDTIEAIDGLFPKLRQLHTLGIEEHRGSGTGSEDEELRWFEARFRETPFLADASNDLDAKD